MLLLALTLSSAHADTDIASVKKFGLGLSTGPALITVTGKYYFGEKAGLAFWAGTSGNFHNARVAYQGEIVHWGDDWSWGQMPLYWHADLDVGIYSDPFVYAGTVFPNVGVGGGVGIALQFKKTPIEVFVDAGLQIVPVHGYCGAVMADTAAATGIDLSGVCWVGGLGSAGGRWYF
ncbi:hypothetical protein LBMAG42_18200 [Deltaproteobacteria bacterium]|nr:hypothetical protein LBMAG42_18200 [Deltaproteobacteria bacterium]